MSILVITGEQSADNHTADVIKEILSSNPELKFWGTGGDQLANAGMEIIEPISNMSCIGITDALKRISYFKNLKKHIIQQVEERQPRLAILVDFAGFNLKVAKKLHAISVPILYFITPKFWAWHQSRIKQIKKYVTHAAVILPFEQELLNAAGINATYVGNPIFEQIPENLESSGLTLGLIPGSREKEVMRMLPILIATAKRLQQEIPIQVMVSMSENLPLKLYQNIPREFAKLKNAHDVIQRSTVLLATSGTTTLEAALMQKPMVITYKTDAFSAFLYNQIAQTKWIGLPNILLNKSLVPEILQKQATPAALANTLLNVIQNPEQQMLGFNAIRESLATKNTCAENVSEIILMLLRKA